MKTERPDVIGDKLIDSQYQPSKAAMEADISIPATPDELLQAVMNYNPSKRD